MAALTPNVDWTREASLPAVLSGDDAERYRRIFTLQDHADWAAADRDIAQVKDRILLGPVLAQRYLDRSYRSRYDELKAWLEAYADEPDARAVYALALKKRPAGAGKTPLPIAPSPSLRFASDDEADALAETSESRAPGMASPGGGIHRHDAAMRERSQRISDEIRQLAPEDPRKAETILASAQAKRLLDDSQLEDARGVIAQAYLAAGDAQRALAIATSGRGAGHPAIEPGSDWEAGLAAWRLNRFADARQHFESVAKANGASPSLIAAAAFWAARSELRTHRPELVNQWLGIAAEHPRTFYGLLARRILGVDSYFNFDASMLTADDVKPLLSMPAGRRAAALIQVDETLRAEAELRILAFHADSALMQTLEALADRANMPALSLQMAAILSDNDGRSHDRALFPVPRWQPIGGFTVDRALIFALMRQESQFLPGVQSSAGAVGLMQIMPATARSMASELGLPVRQRGALTDPAINLTLAQQYIASLARNDRIGNNLVLLAAAYNCGPAPVQRWLAHSAVSADPLLFLESIPSGETRVFTEKVLTNYWIYRQRLGQPTHDLDALAAGNWPAYTALDPPNEIASATDRRILTAETH